MNTYNPYEAPQRGDAVMGFQPADGAQAAILESLSKTRPWVMFLSILGFLGAGFMVLAGLIMMVTGSLTSALAKGSMGAIAPFFSFIYIVLGGVYLVPSILMWRYADAIGQYKRSAGSMEALASAIEKQTSFWRFVGIMTIALMVLYGVGIFAVVVAAVASVSHR